MLLPWVSMYPLGRGPATIVFVKRQSFPLNVPAGANGPGDPFVCADFLSRVVEVSGTFVADVAVEVRIENTWAVVQTVSGSSVVAIADQINPKDVRINVSNYISGQPIAFFAGQATL